MHDKPLALIQREYPSGIYLSEVNMCAICPKLTIKTPEQLHRRCRSDVFIVNFKQFSHNQANPDLVRDESFYCNTKLYSEKVMNKCAD